MPMTAVAPAAAAGGGILVAEAESLNTMDSLSRTVGRCCSPPSGASVRGTGGQDESPLMTFHICFIEGLHQAIPSTAQGLDTAGPELFSQGTNGEVDHVGTGGE